MGEHSEEQDGGFHIPQEQTVRGCLRHARHQDCSRTGEDAWCWSIRLVGLQYARRLGLSRDDSEDSAMALVQRLLPILRARGAGFVSEPYFPFWVKACAWRHTCNRIRDRDLRFRSCISLDTDDGAVTADRCADQELAEPNGRCEFWHAIGRATSRMKPVPGAIFLAYYRDNASIDDLAATCDLTRDAVNSILKRSRKRLPRLLARDGVTEDALLDLVQK